VPFPKSEYNILYGLSFQSKSHTKAEQEEGARHEKTGTKIRPEQRHIKTPRSKQVVPVDYIEVLV